MVNMTLSIPEDLHNEMKKFPEIKWSVVARKSIEERLKILKQAEELVKKSKLKKNDVEELDKLIKKSIFKKIRKYKNNKR